MDVHSSVSRSTPLLAVWYDTHAMFCLSELAFYVDVVIIFYFQGRQGQIRHVFRSYIFLHSRLMTENGGMFVCRARHVVLAGGKVRTQ